MGVSRKACSCPLAVKPSPTIWPQSLMAFAIVSVKVEAGSMSVFKSVMTPPLKMKAWPAPVLVGYTDHLSEVIYRICATIVIRCAGKRTEVRHHAIAVDECVRITVAAGLVVRFSHHLTRGIDSICHALQAAERAQVCHRPVGVQQRMEAVTVGCLHYSDHLPIGIYACCPPPHESTECSSRS